MSESRWLVPALVLLATVGLAVIPATAVQPAGSPAASAQESGTPCTGTVAQPANGTTVVSVQGTKFQGGDGPEKKTARMIAFGPNGTVQWVKPYGSDVVWGYDVDPMENGNLFVTGTVRREGDGDTRVFELDPETGDRVWVETFDALDTHDADLVGEDTIAVANMRNYDEASGVNRDRLYFYDRSSGEVTDEWLFDDHYPREVGGDYEDDWTHFNDVDRVDEDRYLLSPRNFDQVILVNVETGEIELQLGEYRNHDVLRKQHNPDYLESDGGTPTFLVGDSDNDRVVEYAHAGTDVDGTDQWDRTWAVGEGQFDWPRDADRLPNGNTLITDSRNHRVVEVTPQGEVVWEVYTPWLPYDAERIGTGDGSNGPTSADQGAAGTYQLSGAAGHHEDLSAMEDCGEHLDTFSYETASEWPPEHENGSVGTREPPGLLDRAAQSEFLLAGIVLGLLVVVVLGVRSRSRD